MNIDQINKSTELINKKLDVAIIDSQKAIEKAIRKLTNRILSQAATLAMAKGVLRGFKVNFVQLKKIHADIIKLFETEYNIIIRNEIKKLDKIVDSVIYEFRDIGSAIKFTAIDKDMISALKTNTYDQFKQFGEVAQQRVAQCMYDSVIGQIEFSEMTSMFSGIMLGGVDALGRSMSAYAKLYASDSIMHFHRSVHLMKADSAGLDHFLYAGTIMGTTRDFCRVRAGKVFSREEIDTWNGMSWQGKSGNVWTRLGGYNCRHHLRAIPSTMVEEYTK